MAESNNNGTDVHADVLSLIEDLKKAREGKLSIIEVIERVGVLRAKYRGIIFKDDGTRTMSSVTNFSVIGPKKGWAATVSTLGEGEQYAIGVTLAIPEEMDQ